MSQNTEIKSGQRVKSLRRKDLIRSHYDAHAEVRKRWKSKSSYFHNADLKYMKFFIPEGKRVLDLGCGIGDLLEALNPAHGVGIDISPEMIQIAKENHPNLNFLLGDFENQETISSLDEQPFDYIILSDTIGFLEDCQTTFQSLHKLCKNDTRIIVGYYTYEWQPILRLAEILGLRMPQVEQNFIPRSEIRNFLELADFDVINQETRILCPIPLFGLSDIINRISGLIPFIRNMAIRNYTIARSKPNAPMDDKTVSIIIPCRNERDNIEKAVLRIPRMGKGVEIIFIEGHSTDGTFEEVERVFTKYRDQFNINYDRQSDIGKGDAVRMGFSIATGEILMILDADLTVAPEDLPKFYDAIVSGKGNFINGSRMVYPMENDAMRFLNLIANSLFARLFSYLLNQRITDTLCGTKVLTSKHYARIADARHDFGDFDPFGDFALLFGASKQSLKIIDIPVRYYNRAYGETQISRFRHGWLLIQMVWFAVRKLSAI